MTKEIQLPLISKYRPDSFDLVLGNTIAIKQLSEVVKNPVSRPHMYLLTGSAGLGKTTLARIIAKEIDAQVQEINCGVYSGVDDSKGLVEMCGFKPITNKSSVLFIMDECHAISNKGWSPLLKLTEEPPEYAYFCFCTTEANKVPETMKSRAYHVVLKPLKTREIEDLITGISELEGWKLNNDVFNAICVAANGAPRTALSILQAGHSLQTREELAQVIAQVESEDSPVVKLCQYLVKGGKAWKTISPLLKSIDDPEAGLAHAINYLTAVMIRSDESQAKDVWRMIESLSETRASWDKKIQLYSGVGKILWGTIPF